MTIADREQQLATMIKALIPELPVYGVLGSYLETRRLRIPAHRMIQIGIGGWEASAKHFGQTGGADMWFVRIVDSELRSPDHRRIGNESMPGSGLLSIAESLRNGLAGRALGTHRSPLVLRGGRLVSAGEPSAVWEEVFLDFGPASGRTPAVLGESVENIGSLTQPVSAGSRAFDGSSLSSPVFEGDPLLFQTPDETTREFTGAVTHVNGDIIGVERSISNTFPVESTVYRLTDSWRFPVTAASRRLEAVRNASVHHDLQGARHVALLGVPRLGLAAEHDPIREVDAAVCRNWMQRRRESDAFLVGDEDGQVYSAALAADQVTTATQGGLARLETHFHMQAIDSAFQLEAIGA